MSLSASLQELQSLSAQQWLDRVMRTLPTVVAAILAVAIAWQLVQLTWLLLEPAPEIDSAPIVPAATAPARSKGVDVQAIVNAHLFGTPKAPTQDVGPAPETQLPLVLSAVFAAEDPQKGLAIIGESAQQTKVYSVGDSVRTGIRLHSVYPDRVILDRNGKLEALALPKRMLATAMARPAPVPAQNRVVDNLRRVAESNPTALTEIVRPQPVFANGVQRGYRVYPGRNRQQFSRLGLQPGDLVLAINGTPLDDPQRGMEIFNTMGTSDRVQLTIERQGQTQDITLNMSQVSIPDVETGDGSPDRGAHPPLQ